MTLKRHSKTRDALRVSTVCSGIGAPECAWSPLGFEFVFCAEIEPFPCSVLKQHYPHVPNYGDMTKFNDWPDHERIDILAGGTPCQSFSVAGLRGGLADPRGNLALTFLAIVRKYRPTWVVWENVPGVHSSWSDAETFAASEESCRAISEARRAVVESGVDLGADFGVGDFEECDQTSDFDCFLAGLEQISYGVATRVLDAQYFGVAQRRRRVFFVGHIGGEWQRAAAVLFERDSLRGNPPPRREAGKGTSVSIAPSLGASGRGFERAGETRGQDPVIAEYWCNASHPSGEYKCTREKGHAGYHCRFKQDGVTGKYDNIWWPIESKPFAFQPRIARNGRGEMGDLVNAIQAESGETGKGDAAPCVVVHALKGEGFDASEDGTGRGTPIVPEIACALQERDSKGSDSSTKPGHLIPFFQEKTVPMAVRRLTPRECERLQGFPDDYTLISFRGKPAADGPRYKALGNSMAVPVMRWIGKRIQQVQAIA
jgi:DNA (cytosine-5)-methyltransferase 1